MKKILVLLSALVIIVFNGCTDKDNAKRILSNDGYEKITITGLNHFSCREMYRTGFIAYKNGKEIKGTVCTGFFKDSTIRIK